MKETTPGQVPPDADRAWESGERTPAAPARPDAIRIRDLRKLYGRDEALRGLDLSIPEGAMVLLVGPNGAGKTTLLRVMIDLAPFSSGEVTVLGMSPREEGARIRAATGYLPETTRFPFDRLRVREILDFHARFRPSWDPAYADALVERLELGTDRRWKKLSKGEARRVQVVVALAHRPTLLLLDEPTDGLDPIAREVVLRLLAEHLAETGATTLYCTHVLHEAQGLADRLAVIHAGAVRVDEDAETLRRTHFRVRFSPEGGGAPPSPPPFLLREEARDRDECQWIVRAEEREVRGWAERHGVDLLELERISLEDTARAHLAAAAQGGGVTQGGGAARGGGEAARRGAAHPGRDEAASRG